MTGRIKKLMSCLLLVLILSLSTAVCVNANSVSESEEKEIGQLRFTYISMFTNAFDISQYGYAEINSYMDAYGVDQVRITANLQQYVNGNWQTIKSWTSIRDGDWNTLDKGRYVLSGYFYRYVTYGYVYIDDFVVESTSYTSSWIYY